MTTDKKDKDGLRACAKCKYWEHRYSCCGYCSLQSNFAESVYTYGYDTCEDFDKEGQRR